MVDFTVGDWVRLAVGIVSTFASSWLFYWLTRRGVRPGRPGRSTRAGSRWLWVVLGLGAVLAVTAWGAFLLGTRAGTVVGAPPDLVVTDLSVDPTSAPAGSKVTVRLTIRNQGERTSEACSVTFVIEGSGLFDESQSHPVPTINAGQSWKTSTSVTITSHRKVGEGSIIGWIDRAGNLSESESGRANNTRSVTFTVTAPGGSGDGAVQLEPAASPVLAAGGWHSLAVASDGTVWAWGGNEYGQVGDGTTTDRLTPVQVQGLADVVAIAAGEDHTVALRRDGTVFVWGWCGLGEIDAGRRTPVVQAMADVVAIAGGGWAQASPPP